MMLATQAMNQISMASIGGFTLTLPQNDHPKFAENIGVIFPKIGER